MVDDLNFLRERNIIYSDTLTEAKEVIEGLEERLFYSSRRKVIMGCKASGKTHTIQNELLPKLNGRYAIVDLHNEYSSFNKHDGDVLSHKDILTMLERELYGGDLTMQQRWAETIINYIERNRNKTIVIDGMDFLERKVDRIGYFKII